MEIGLKVSGLKYESKFNLFGSDGILWVRHPAGTKHDPRYQTPTVKHGGDSIMVWGCFSASRSILLFALRTI